MNFARLNNILTLFKIPKSPTEVELVKPNNMAYIHGGRYAPMSCKLVEHV